MERQVNPKIINEKIISKVKDAVSSVIPDAEIILYGSRARGDATEFSDWDFLVLSESSVSREGVVEVRDRLYDTELETDTILSTIIRSKAEWESAEYSNLPFKKEIEDQGILL